MSQWESQLPDKLRYDKSAEAVYETAELLDSQFGAANARNWDHNFQVQALLLKLALENTRMLIHRPILLHRMCSSQANADASSVSGKQSSNCSSANSFQASLVASYDAALETASSGDSPVFQQASSTYAVSFVSMHLCTAGVTLSIIVSLEPLSTRSHHAKTGLRKLMEMQRFLRSCSAVAAQGLERL